MRKRKYSHLEHVSLGSGFCDISEIPQSKRAVIPSTNASARRTDDAKEQDAHDDTPEAQIHNLVGTALIQSSVLPLNLHMIARLLPNVVYDRQKFAAITIRLHSPMCTSLLFTSGKMVLTGCKNFTACVLASHHIVSILRRGIIGVKFELAHVQIQNIVGNVDVGLNGRRMNLQRLFTEHGIFCTYQRNMFPGLIYRPDNSPVVLLIFNSGKIVITGGKSSVDVMQGWSRLWPFVKQYIEPST
jgi:transcription initiation factor TFIID TATA-box-binding protein